MTENKNDINRRHFLRSSLWAAGLTGLGAAAGFLSRKTHARNTVWQIDPEICVACGNCATYCVLEESAVKCVHAHAICGYCRICFGFFGPEPADINEAAENQLCPTGAIIRKYMKDDHPYYEYTIDEPLCMGCGKCVLGCNTFGNGSLFLQVRHDRCLNCNECSIAAACPSGAYKRVPADKPYLLKKVDTVRNSETDQTHLSKKEKRMISKKARRFSNGVDSA